MGLFATEREQKKAFHYVLKRKQDVATHPPFWQRKGCAGERRNHACKEDQKPRRLCFLKNCPAIGKLV